MRTRQILRRRRRHARPEGLTPAQRSQWEHHGFLVLPGLFPTERVTALRDELDRLWGDRRVDDRGLVVDVFLDGHGEGARRIPFGAAPDEARDHPYKLNDLYLVSDLVREAILDRQLVDVVDGLLDGAPAVCNSLTFERGSQQRFHFDTFYMPPLVADKMLATWIALEDTDARTGPLRYFPGSHKIPPYRFSDGRLQQDPAEMDDFDRYIDEEIARRELAWTEFHARAGDVFVWHAQLYHGGAPIEDMSLTRRSLVTHYYRAGDLDPGSVVDIGGGRYYLQRPHQAAEGGEP